MSVNELIRDVVSVYDKTFSELPKLVQSGLTSALVSELYDASVRAYFASFHGKQADFDNLPHKKKQSLTREYIYSTYKKQTIRDYMGKNKGWFGVLTHEQQCNEVMRHVLESFKPVAAEDYNYELHKQ